MYMYLKTNTERFENNTEDAAKKVCGLLEPIGSFNSKRRETCRFPNVSPAKLAKTHITP